LSHRLGAEGQRTMFILGSLESAYTGLPIVLIELFSLGRVTVEALRAKIDRKLAISLQRSQFDPKFQVEADVPHQ